MPITPYRREHRDRVLALSLRAWEGVFPLLEPAVSPFVFRCFYPEGWRARLSADVGVVLDDEPQNCDVGLVDGRPVGWVCTRLHPEDGMAEIYVLAVDPEWQRHGIGRALIQHSADRARAAGMGMIMAETGDDPGHAVRSAYESDDFERWPVARYFKDLATERTPAGQESLLD